MPFWLLRFAELRARVAADPALAGAASAWDEIEAAQRVGARCSWRTPSSKVAPPSTACCSATPAGWCGPRPSARRSNTCTAPGRCWRRLTRGGEGDGLQPQSNSTAAIAEESTTTARIPLSPDQARRRLAADGRPQPPRAFPQLVEREPLSRPSAALRQPHVSHCHQPRSSSQTCPKLSPAYTARNSSPNT